MLKIRRILISIKDPDARALPAVVKGTQLARSLGAEVELFHAIDTPLFVDLTRSGADERRLEADARDEYLRKLERVAARVRGKGLKVSTAAEWDYPGYEAIVRRADRIGADLIVAERHAGRHIAPWLLHMSDWELLRLSPVPVLIVKSSRAYRRPAIVAAVDPTHAFAKPSGLDETVLQLGNIVQKALRGKLHAVHACMPVLSGIPTEAWAATDYVDRLYADAAAKARVALGRVLRSANIPAARRHLLACHPIDAIERVAAETNCAIVVMGAVSRSGIKSVFIGNTAERVLDHLTCDLLVVKPQRFEARVPRTVRGARIAAAVPLP